MLSTGEYADVHFWVGDGDEKECVPAHKLILMNASDVFETMFRFDSQNAKAENDFANCPFVELPDVEAAAFKVMLRFIYTDALSGLNGDNAMAVLYAADKYNITDLVLPCLLIFISELRNVFVAYVQARLFDLEDFVNCCLSYIDKNADALIKSEEFLQIDQKTLSEIFGRDELQIHEEITIWKTCRENGIECPAENRRAVLGPALFKIRFPLLSSEEFAKDIVPSGVLTMDEVFGIQQTKIQPNFDQFSNQQRIWTKGTLLLDIEKLSEFAGEKVGSRRFSETVHIKRPPWKIVTQITTDGTDNEKWLGIYLLCDALKEGIDGHRKEDKVTLAIDVTVKDEKMEKFVWDQNKLKWTLSICEKSLEVNVKATLCTSMDLHGKLWHELERKMEALTMRNGWAFSFCVTLQKKTKIGVANVRQFFELFRKRTASLTPRRNLAEKQLLTAIRARSHDKYTFYSFENSWGFSNFASFAQLMDPSNDFYNQNEDKVTLSIDFTVKDEVPDVVIRVFEFNDHLLRRSVWIEK
ncbi:hypothetical protein niasHS_004675 [Heterodera schachtii]|uniref:BTB domain-containing protein n=1 Tax=Heterodera schachtii TaxID=97005 RepID=A0ABD2JSN8_HETSC